MSQIDTNATLWKNISALMVKHWGDENLNRLARECKFGPGTAARIKEQKTSVGLETLDKIADHFNLAVWQLLVPGLDPENPPAIQPISAAERKLYEQFKTIAKTIASDLDAKDYLR
jgi:transcriptional regulator with XRE-family HTH domain